MAIDILHEQYAITTSKSVVIIIILSTHEKSHSKWMNTTLDYHQLDMETQVATSKHILGQNYI